MRILLISGEYPPDVGGVGDYTRRLGLALAERGHDIAVLTGRYGLIEFRVPRSEFRVTDEGASGAGMAKPADEAAKLKTRNSHLATWSLQPVRAAIAAFRPDIVHLQYQTGAYGMHPAVMLLPARLRRLRPPVAVAVTAHDLRLPYLFPRADALRGWLTARLLGDADVVIVTNRDDARRLDGLAPPDRELYSPTRPLAVRRCVIPIGSNVQPAPITSARAVLRADIGAGPDDVVVAYFGLLSRTKGLLDLLEALAGLDPRFRLTIVGGAAPLPDDRRFASEVESSIVEHALAERVTITGPLPEAEVSAHLLAADVAALPFADGASYRRGSLLAVLAHGLPTVTTAPAAALDPPLVDGRHALLVPSSDVAALREAIRRLAGDDELRRRLAAGAHELAAGFGWPSIAACHESVYHSLRA